MKNPARSRGASGTSAVWRTRDVAAFWQRTPTTVMRWVDAGDHPPPRLDPGGQRFWLAAEVEEFARSGQTEPAERDHPAGTTGRDAAPTLALVIGDGSAS